MKIFLRQMNILHLLFIILLTSHFLTLNASNLDKPEHRETDQIAFIHTNIITGDGQTILYDQTIKIDQGKITAIGSFADVSIERQYQIYDMTGKTMIPGIVGVHNHLHVAGRQADARLIAKFYFAFGVTTIQTCGARDGNQEVSLAKMANSHRVPMPYILASAPYISGPSGNPNMQPEITPKQAREFVREWVEKGVQWFKVYRHIKPNVLNAITDEAHQHNAYVTGHLCSITYQEALAAKLDGFQHGWNSVSDFRDGKTVGQCNGLRTYIDELAIDHQSVKDLQDLMIKQSAFLTSTLSIYEASISHRKPIADQWLPYFHSTLIDSYNKQRASFDQIDSKREARFGRIKAFDRQFFQRGGLLGSGVDAGRFNLPGAGDLRNFELLIEAGFSVPEAIQVLTANGAKILNLSKRGQIKVGSEADLVVINGSLEKDPSLIYQQQWVIKRGRIFETQELRKNLLGKYH
ncbi:MAG: amidohydrolase family protein [Gammaproteobacteria bacterium]|nr:amidohydrolase family protein [Gammaproteobacteria bacterium]